MGGTCSPERAPSSRGAWRRHVAPRSVSSGAQRPRLWRRPVVVVKSPDSGELPPRRPVALPRRAPGVPRRPPVLRLPRVACKFAVSAFNAGRLRPSRSPPLTASSSWSLSATGCCSPDGDACCWALAGVRAGSPARAGIADNPRTNAVTTKNLMVFSLPVGKTCDQELKPGRLSSARWLDARHLEDVLGTDGCSAEDAVAEDVGLDDGRYVDRNVHGNWFDMDVQRRCHVHRNVHQDERVTRLHLIELGIAQPGRLRRRARLSGGKGGRRPEAEHGRDHCKVLRHRHSDLPHDVCSFRYCGSVLPFASCSHYGWKVARVCACVTCWPAITVALWMAWPRAFACTAAPRLIGTFDTLTVTAMFLSVMFRLANRSSRAPSPPETCSRSASLSFTGPPEGCSAASTGVAHMPSATAIAAILFISFSFPGCWS